MKRSIILVCVLAVALVGTLYSLPKVVVNSKSQNVSTEQTAAQEPESEGHLAESANDNHTSQALTPEQQQNIEKLRGSYNQATPGDRVAAAAKLSDAFSQYQKFDSAAYYAEQAALLSPAIENWLRAGDRYYEAFGFAVDESKAKRMGEKTREYYQKALEKNPELLAAKANMAMTYVNTASPMQGIMLMREVLDTDPTNELALFNLGILSMRSNQYSKAVERFQQIVRNNPSNTKAQFYLGVSLVELGRDDEARTVLAEVKKKETDPVIQQAIGELEQRLK
jgi:tetratricopeptide (TPR) repeat protein